MRTRVKIILPLIFIFFVTGAFGCSYMVKDVPDIPESAGITYMETWWELADNYNQEVATPNLSEDYKDILEKKREALIGLFYGAKLYNEYIQYGYVTAETLNEIWEKYINIAEVPFFDLVQIYEDYKESGSLDPLMLENVLEMVIDKIETMVIEKTLMQGGG